MKKISIYAKQEKNLTSVRALVREFMDEAGATTPYVRQITCKHKATTVLDAELSKSMAAEPYFQFSFKGGAVGDEISLEWQDNKGGTGSATSVIR